MAPTTPAPSPAKVCIVCKQDCSNRPRNKDEQGRYTCQDCAKKMATAGASRGGSASAVPPKPVVKATASSGAPAVAASAKQAAGRGPGGGDDGLYKLAADPLPAYMFEEKPVELTAEQETCQNCGHVMRKSHVICIKCGHNKQNHKTLHTVLKRPEIINDGKKKKAGISLDNIYVVGAVWLVSLASVGLAIAASSSNETQMMALSVLILFCVGGILYLAATIGAFFENILVGLGMVVYGGLFFLPVGQFYVRIGGLIYLCYWMACECESGFTKHTFFAALLQIIMLIIFAINFVNKVAV